MSRRTLGALVALLMLVGAGWYGVAASAASRDTGPDAGWPQARTTSSLSAVQQRAERGGGGRTLIFVSEEVRAAEIDINEDGFGPGDFFMFEERLFNSRGNKQVGRDSVRCELVIRTFGCYGTMLHRGKGKIEVSGRLFGPRDLRLAVTGGTGDYQDVGGQLDVLDLRGGRSALVFHLTR